MLRDRFREPLRAQRDPLAAGAGRLRSDRDVHRQWRKQTWLGRFVSTYGWRAYALPVLMTLTIVVVYQTVTGLGVVMLRPVNGAFKKRTPKTRVIEQRGKQFAPHVMAVPVGSTVSFPNFDAIYHNVFSISKTKAFDLGMYQKGELRELTFDKPGLVRLSCNIHSNMSAYLIVVDDPHYAVVEEGKFAFNSLAPGKYRVQAWSERGGAPTVTEIDIKPGENTAPIDLTAGEPEPDHDKFGATRGPATAPTPAPTPAP